MPKQGGGGFGNVSSRPTLAAVPCKRRSSFAAVSWWWTYRPFTSDPTNLSEKPSANVYGKIKLEPGRITFSALAFCPAEPCHPREPPQARSGSAPSPRCLPARSQSLAPCARCRCRCQRSLRSSCRRACSYPRPCTSRLPRPSRRFRTRLLSSPESDEVVVSPEHGCNIPMNARGVEVGGVCEVLSFVAGHVSLLR